MDHVIKKTQFRVDLSTQPIKAISVKKETTEERYKRLKKTADATGKRYFQVYLEDERQRKGDYC